MLLVTSDATPGGTTVYSRELEPCTLGAGTGYAGHCIGAYRMRQHGVGHATIMYAESWNRQTWELHRAYRMLPPAMKTAATIHDGAPTHDGSDVVFAASVVIFCDDRR